MVRPGSGRFEVGLRVGFRVGLRARDSPTEEVLSRTPLIIRTVPPRRRAAVQWQRWWELVATAAAAAVMAAPLTAVRLRWVADPRGTASVRGQTW